MPELWPHFNTEELADRAWGIRQRVKSKVSRNSETQLWAKHGKELWNKTIFDMQLGFCLSPYTSEDEVSAVLQTDAWIAMPRFSVLQGGKARPVDDGSATGSHANGFSAITERLTLPTMDVIIISMARALKLATGESIGGRVVDETSAFRQLPILPRDRSSTHETAVSRSTKADPESANEGHFDKICDQISDVVTDACLTCDTKCKVACETCVKDNMFMVAGEITVAGKMDHETVVRGVVHNIEFDSFTDDMSSVGSKGLKHQLEIDTMCADERDDHVVTDSFKLEAAVSRFGVLNGESAELHVDLCTSSSEDFDLDENLITENTQIGHPLCAKTDRRHER